MSGGDWIRTMEWQELKAEGRAVVRPGGRQIALFLEGERVFACNNRCPHEGYPLVEGKLAGGGNGEKCLLTCNWHNWKFDLADGANQYGGDSLRVYPVEVRDGAVWLDLTEPPPESRQAEVLVSLRQAFDDHAYARLARETARYELAGGNPADVVAEAIVWAHDRMEFGWTHAFAGAGGWLDLFDAATEDAEARLICLVESVAHMAEDVLRHPVYPFAEEVQPWGEAAFAAAVEAQDEPGAIALTRGALRDGLGFAGLERALSRAALAHYNDFGHSLIYVVKAGRLIGRLGGRVEGPLLFSLVRKIVYATREDMIPEFKKYAAAIDTWPAADSGKTAPPDPEAYRGLNVRRALELTTRHGAAAPEALYQALLAANAHNMLTFDLAWRDRTDRPLADNIDWLDFTHGITFANAVRLQCTRYPELWPAGLLQLACFSGRNAKYTDAEISAEDWRVADSKAFLDGAAREVLDHRQPEYIVSVHLLKTMAAVREEIMAGAEAPSLLPALKRFLNNPPRRKNTRRVARQALDFVAIDG